MLKKTILSLILICFMGFGLFLLATLYSKLSLTRKGALPQEPEFIPFEESQEVVGIKEVLDFEKANDIAVGRIGPGNTPIIEMVRIEKPGYVVIYQSQKLETGDVLGFSQLLPQGESLNVAVYLKRELLEGEIVYIGLRLDDGDRFFEFTGRYDKNVSRADGTPIIWSVEVKG